ncbi:MAG: DNA-directed RNA polymerase subunit E'' [Candidatus Altiarchaeales archaeon]|nr:DNA-directed RNA polymerase subunit E'' [Candidatus Altiarchaeales archaeon]
MRACKKCSRLTDEEICPVCQAPTSQYWSGYIGIVDPEKSQVAIRLEIKTPGQYAFKVR